MLYSNGQLAVGKVWWRKLTWLKVGCVPRICHKLVGQSIRLSVGKKFFIVSTRSTSLATAGQ